MILKRPKTKQAFTQQRCYLGEAGISSIKGQEEQARVDLNDWKIAQDMKLGVTFMSLQNNKRRATVDHPEEGVFGWIDSDGNPKQVYVQMRRAWGVTTPMPTPHAVNVIAPQGKTVAANAQGVIGVTHTMNVAFPDGKSVAVYLLRDIAGHIERIDTSNPNVRFYTTHFVNGEAISGEVVNGDSVYNFTMKNNLPSVGEKIGTLKVRNTFTFEGKVITTYERHDNSGAIVKLYGIITSSSNKSEIGLEYVDFYPGKIGDGKTYEGKVIVGFRWNPHRPIYYYDSKGQWFNREGKVVNDTTKYKVVGWAIRTADRINALPNNISQQYRKDYDNAWAQDRILISEEQDYQGNFVKGYLILSGDQDTIIGNIRKLYKDKNRFDIEFIVNNETESNRMTYTAVKDENIYKIGWLTDKSGLLDIYGKPLDLSRTSISDVLANKSGNRVGGDRYFYNPDGKPVSYSYQMVRDTWGRPLELFYGINTKEGFQVQEKVYIVYNPNRTNHWEIADHTVATIIIGGKEFYQSYLVNPDLQKDSIDSETKRGIAQDAANNALNAVPEADRYAFVAQMVLSNNDIETRFISESQETVFDNNGRLLATINSPAELTNNGLPANDSEQQITFFIYSNINDDRIASGAQTYEYVKGQKDISFYKGREVIINSSNGRFINAIDENGNSVPAVVFDTHYERKAKQSIVGRVIRLNDGRLLAEYQDSEFLKSPRSIVFFDDYGFPTRSYLPKISSFDEVIKTNDLAIRAPYRQFYIALVDPQTARFKDQQLLLGRITDPKVDPAVKGMQGLFAVWEQDITTAKNEGRVWTALDFLNMKDKNVFKSEALEGRIVQGQPHLIFSSYDEAITLSQQGGTLYHQDTAKFEIKDKFITQVWRDYKSTSFVEFLQVHDKKHMINAWENFITHKQGLDKYFDLITMIVGGLLAITAIALVALLGGTRIIQKLHFRHMGKKAEAFTAGVVNKGIKMIGNTAVRAVLGAAIGVTFGATIGNFLAIILAVVGGLLMAINAHVRALGLLKRWAKQKLDKKIKPEFRQKKYIPPSINMKDKSSLAWINRHLYLLRPFTNYLGLLYQEKDIQAMIDHYYPSGHPKRASVNNAFRKINQDDQKEKRQFIEKYFINPIAQLWGLMVVDQIAKWKDYNEGRAPQKLINYYQEKVKDDFGKEIGYIVLPDRAIRMIFENFIMEHVRAQDGQSYGSVLNDNDPMTSFGLNRYLDIDLLANSKLPEVEAKMGDKIEDVLVAFKKAVVLRYRNEGLKTSSFPVKLHWGWEIGFGLFYGILGLTGLVLLGVSVVTVIGAKALGITWGVVTAFVLICYVIKAWNSPQVKIKEVTLTPIFLILIGIVGTVVFGLLGWGAVHFLTLGVGYFALTWKGAAIYGYGIFRIAVKLREYRKFFVFHVTDWPRALLRILATSDNYAYDRVSIDDLGSIVGGEQNGRILLNELINGGYLKQEGDKYAVMAKYEVMVKQRFGDYTDEQNNEIINLLKERYEIALKLKVKEHFFATYYSWLFFSNAMLWSAGIYYFSHIVPGPWAWIPGIFILILTSRESIRSWWYMFSEAATTAIQENQRWFTYKNYGQINKEALNYLRDPDLSFLRDSYLDNVLQKTLLERHMIRQDQKEELEKVLNPGVSRMPKIKGLSKDAQEELVKFFNQIIMTITIAGGKEGFIKQLNAVKIEDLWAWIFKGTGKEENCPGKRPA